MLFDSFVTNDDISYFAIFFQFKPDHTVVCAICKEADRVRFGSRREILDHLRDVHYNSDKYEKGHCDNCGGTIVLD